MGPIDEIIKVLDDKLLESGKPYLTLTQANTELVNKKLLSVSEKVDNKFKKILEDQLIPNALQTDKKPKQWRIFLSDEGKKRKKHFKDKIIRKKPIHKQKSYQLESRSLNYSTCPNCGKNLSIPNEIINKTFLKCTNCGKDFRNSLKNKNQDNITEDFKLTKTQRNWVIGIAVVIILYIIGNFSGNDSSSSSSSSIYYINNSTYAATSKSNFDEMFRYINDGDIKALTTLQYYGKVEMLNRGTEVYLVDAHLSYRIVRKMGSTQSLWVVSEHLSKK